MLMVIPGARPWKRPLRGGVWPTYASTMSIAAPVTQHPKHRWTFESTSGATCSILNGLVPFIRDAMARFKPVLTKPPRLVGMAGTLQ
jgi:hypothetical protein